jgi:ABC-type antimicrobial peptide transport system permease subunit
MRGTPRRGCRVFETREDTTESFEPAKHRLALGATRGQIMQLVLKEAARLILVGLVIGLVGSLAPGRTVGSLLFEISPRDPLCGAVDLLRPRPLSHRDADSHQRRSAATARGIPAFRENPRLNLVALDYGGHLCPELRCLRIRARSETARSCSAGPSLFRPPLVLYFYRTAASASFSVGVSPLPQNPDFCQKTFDFEL